MFSKVLLTLTAILFFAAGGVLDFAPQETAAAAGLANSVPAALILQALAGACFGFGLLNWFARTRPMGGIYARPLALSNLLFFGVAAIPLDRAVLHGSLAPAFAAVAAATSLFAAAFAWITFFHNPVTATPPQAGTT